MTIKQPNKKEKEKEKKKEKKNTTPHEWHKRLNTLNPKFKTQYCKTWYTNKICIYGCRCVFAHSKEELNIIIKNTHKPIKNKNSINYSDSTKLNKLEITKSIVNTNDIFIEINNDIYKSNKSLYIRTVSRYNFAR